MFIYLFWERESEQGRGRERKRDRESQAGSTAVSAEPDVGIELMNLEVMTSAETKSQMLNQLSHPDAFIHIQFKTFSNFPFDFPLTLSKLKVCYLVSNYL